MGACRSSLMRQFFLSGCLFLSATSAWALELRLGATGGVMLQPTSSYYHGIYGGTLDLATDRRRLILRGAYFERPLFESVGFKDQDQGWSSLLGTSIKSLKKQDFLAFLGVGRVAGMVRETQRDDDQPPFSRSYAMPALTTAVEYVVELGRMTLGVGHQTYIAFGGEDQTRALVAWPYNLFHIQVGAFL